MSPSIPTHFTQLGYTLIKERAGCFIYNSLENGEQIELVMPDGVVASVGAEVLPGVLVVTNLRLLFFESNDGTDDVSVTFRPLTCVLPIGLISRVSRSSQLMLHSGLKRVAGLQIESKRADILHLFFTLNMSGSVLDGLETRLAVAKASQIPLTTLIARDLGVPAGEMRPFDIHAEMERQGVTDSGVWRPTAINAEYAVTPTYPRVLYVPSCVDDDVLLGSAKFRSRSRFPVLSWYDRETGGAIARSAQPLTGLTSAVSVEDIQLMDGIRSSVPSPERAVIVDCRSHLAATGNRLKGKGTENINQYPGYDLRFMGMENIHEIRRSFEALQTLVASSSLGSESSWLTQLSRTRWLGHTHDILVAALQVVLIVKSGQAVVVHCSDSWDRSPVVVALAQILLDPFFRTRAGFEQLIHREFMSFGHRFATRLGIRHGLGKHEIPRVPSNLASTAGAAPKNADVDVGTSSTSPVFVSFLDAVESVRDQFPEAFEFTSNYLVAWGDACSSEYFAEFAFDFDCTRVGRAHAPCLSVFEYFRTHPVTGTGWDNGGYVPMGRALLPVTSLKILGLWSYFLRFDRMFFRRFHRVHLDESEPVLWVPDAFQESCYSCLAEFRLWRRRHHCRRCGRIFCGSCTGVRVELPCFRGKQRVCGPCLRQLAATPERSEGGASSSSASSA